MYNVTHLAVPQEVASVTLPWHCHHWNAFGTMHRGTVDLRLVGRVALVCGASSGLGLAAATSLAQEGARVVMVARRADRLRGEAARIGGHPYPADLSKGEDRQRLIEWTVAEFGRLDVLVWNTGGPPKGPARDLTATALQSTVEELFVPLVDLVGLALKPLIASGSGRIIAITAAGVREPTDIALSNAVRPGIVGYLKSLATELAPNGVTVNNVAPGRFLTSRLASLFPNGAPEQLLTEIPIQRLGRPSELGDVIAFLASSQASYVTGTTVVVDGGLSKSIF